MFQMLFCGSQRCFENYETASYYGSSGISHSTGKAIDHSVMPLLKSMVQMLEEDSRSYVSSETPGERGVEGPVSCLVLLWPLKTYWNLSTLKARKRDSPFWQKLSDTSVNLC